MRVFVQTDDDTFRSLARGAIATSGDQLVASLADADAAIVDVRSSDGPDQLRAFATKHMQLDLLAVALPESAADLPSGPAEIGFAPVTEAGLAARLTRIDRHRTSDGTRRRDMLAMAVQACGDVVEICSPNSVIEYVNPAFTEVIGYTADEAIGSTPAKLFRSGMHDRAYYEDVESTLNAGKVWNGILISKAKDGRLVHLETSISPVIDDDGAVTQFVVVKRDITERLAAEARLRATNEELVLARDAALEASRVKSQFLASMSHELRTPLNAIIGYSEMLQEDAQELEAESFVGDLGKIQTAGKHLLGLINDVLDLSKIEAGKMELFIEQFQLRPLLDEVLSTIEPLARERRNSVSLSYDFGDTPLLADELRLRQVVFNLMSNAVKFTEGGSIEVRAFQPDEHHCAISVSDSGIGMTEEHMGKLFEPFGQADASTTREYGGTGLGLTISRRFCEMMGGTIVAESSAGVGSTFTVTIPSRGEQAPSFLPSLIPRDDDATPTVLVIDDDPIVHDLLSRALGPAGFEVETAMSGHAGLEAAREGSPDVIVLDVIMPDLDGWAVLTELKRMPETQEIPVVMLTFVENRSTGLALGASDYLIKPVEPSRLVSVVRRYVGAGASEILIVEDEPTTREIMRRALSAAGHNVHLAEHGGHALEMLETMRPDVILLDLMMPVVNGFEFLERLRAREELADVPTIVVTAMSLGPDDLARLNAATVLMVTKKPATRRELTQLVARQVRHALRRQHERA